MQQTVIFRVDAGAEIGMGHLSRCMTLARALQRRGAKVGFIGTQATLRHARGKLRNAFWHTIPKGLSQMQDAARCKLLLRRHPCATMVVDHYALGALWESHIAPYAGKLVAIDDLAREHVCDMLIDQNHHTNRRRYDRKLPHGAKQLLGPRYAMLRDTVRRLMPAEPVEKKALHLFVCFGGSDMGGMTGKVLQVLQSQQKYISGCDVVVGRHYPDIPALQALLAKLPSATLHIDHPAPEILMHHADIGIGAGGVMMWERSAAGLPGYVISIADNQREGCESMAKDGLIEYLGAGEAMSSAGIAKPLETLMTGYKKRYEMAQKAQKLVDGFGAARVARSVLNV